MQQKLSRRRMNGIQRFEFVLYGLLLMLCASEARADDPPAPKESVAARAKDALVRGAADIRAGRVNEGCRLIEESIRLIDSFNGQIQLAACLSKVGAPGRAALHLKRIRLELEGVRADPKTGSEEARGLARLDDQAATLALQLLPLLADLPHIKLALDESMKRAPGLVVTVDGTRVDPAEASEGIPVDPGYHVIKVAAPGWNALVRDVEIKATQEIEMMSTEDPGTSTPTELDPTATPPIAPILQLPQRRPAVEVGRSAAVAPGIAIGPRIVIGAGIAVGVVGIAVGIAYGAAFLDAKRDYVACKGHRYTCPDGRENQRVYDETRSLLVPEGIGFVVGGIGLGAAGLAALLLPPSRSRSTGIHVSPQVGPGQVGVGFLGQF